MKRWLLLLVALPAYGRVLTTRPTPSEAWNPVLSLTVGSGVEYEPDRYEFPLLVEYNLTEQLLLTVEPVVVYDPKVAGWGDLETTLGWEFLRERRYRPALTAEAGVRWPTATNTRLGDPGHDYSMGLIASKDFVYADVDVSLHYDVIAEDENEVELAVAAEVPINHRWSLLLELVSDFRDSGSDTEGTAGFAWKANEYLTLEIGGTLQSDGTWKISFAWEWNFAGED